ncbi:MAG: serine kinase [Prolixibacteraceae bacterium]|nr:serine kinase [Prolixibacteraceae bacterium]
MKVSDLIEKLGLTVFAGSGSVSNEISGGYVSDLLSDVMGKAREGEVWITLQNHLNVIAVASLKDLSAIVLVNGITPSPDVVEKANQEGIPVLGTTEPAFSITGKIYRLIK